MTDLSSLSRLFNLDLVPDRPDAAAEACGVEGAGRAGLIAALAARLGRLVVAVFDKESDARAALADLRLIEPGLAAALFDPASAALPAALHTLERSGPAALIAVEEILHGPAPLLDERPDATLTLEPGAALEPARLAEWLENNNYERTDLATEPGEYAARGGIIDVFPDEADLPLRVEFGPDAVDSLRRFDPLSQRSQSAEEHVVLATRVAPKRSEDAAATVIPAGAFVLGEAGCTALEARLVLHPGTGRGIDFGFRPAPTFLGNTGLLRTQLDSAGTDWLIACSSEHQLERLRRLVGDRPGLLVAALSRGFVHEPSGLTLLTEREVYGAPVLHTARRRFKGLPLDNLVALRPGDHVVHIDYGVGRFEGTKRMTAAGIEKDYLIVRYAGQDRVYVPVENIGLLDRFIGSDEAAPQLDRLGGRSWLQAKAKAARSSAEYAGELLDLYARRSVSSGTAHPPDSAWAEAVEASFPHDETEDQLTALAAVRADMERARPMDRLVCGDVGYGKTEIALRAAVKAVTGLKQVAVLAPTTILCYQHFANFRKRLAGLPVRVEMLSRLVDSGTQGATLRGLTDGTVDIVIGTHLLLSQRVRFRDLGLIVVDEEQRFGVRQKERLKQLRAAVDVLTLTATPIPRTLYMALAGLRDIAQLNTPPPGRRDIATDVAPWNDALVRDYIHREINRGGQVFFVHNEIRDIDRVAERLARLLPGARIAVAHGQMTGRELARIYLGFAGGGYDILLSTAIIESGVDLPNVNTIIVDRADRFGLADLHQLRGRVGRSELQAYALFLVPSDREVTVDARKRLSALVAYSRLGSGYRLAVRDMEIRGVGNLLGTEQHGHVARVGFNLYAQMLKEAVARQKGETIAPEPELSLDVRAVLPTEYVPDGFERVAIYKRLLGVASPGEIDDLRDEMTDRFGKPPPSLDDLLRIARVRVLARRAGLERVSLKAGKVALTGPQGTTRFDGGIDALLDWLERQPAPA
ncbi:MAG: transcription-repair coupling factor [bacterium]